MSHDFNALLDNMVQPMHRALVQHWLALFEVNGRQQLPGLHQIDAIAFGRYLPDICILDHEGGDRFVYRLAGGNVDDFYGQPVKGRSMADLMDSPTRERLLDMAHAILKPPTAVMHGLSSMLPQWNYSVALTRISLPLADREGVARHIISATVFRYDRDNSHAMVTADFQHRYRIPLPGEDVAAQRSAG